MQQDNRNGVTGWMLLYVLFKFVSPLFSLVYGFVAAISQNTPYPGIYSRASASATLTNTIMLLISLTLGATFLGGVLADIGILMRRRWTLAAVAIKLGQLRP